ncbi:MAG: regulatory protein RecX [Solirubrobacteraceae bacterium]
MAEPEAASDLDAQVQRALALACAQLNRRERTVAEVRLQLERRGIPERAVDQAIQALTDQRMLDDARFASMFVSDKRELEQWGRERIMRGLVTRGVDRALAEAALAAGCEPAAGDPGEAPPQIDGREAELERALELLRRRFPQPPRERRDRDRALGLLLRKGYESELAVDALAAHARGPQ